MAEDIPSEAFDKFDIWYFVIGIGFTLMATVALKYLFEGGATSCYHSHFHGGSAPQSHHGSVFGMDGDGKIYRRGYL